jgi:hypothetical protein
MGKGDAEATYDNMAIELLWRWWTLIETSECATTCTCDTGPLDLRIIFFGEVEVSAS